MFRRMFLIFRIMVWSSEKDELLCREVITYGAAPLQGWKKGTRKCLKANSICFKFNLNRDCT